MCLIDTSDPVGRQRGETEARDRHEPFRHAGRVQGRIPPERAVAGQVRSERERCRHDRTDPEQEGHPVAKQGQSRKGEDRNDPTQEDERLETVARVAADEIGELRGVSLDLGE